MTPEFYSFIIVGVLMLAVTYIFLWKEDRGLAGIMILITGAYMGMSTIASSGTERYFFYLAVMLIGLGIFSIIQGLTNRTKAHGFSKSGMGFLE